MALEPEAAALWHSALMCAAMDDGKQACILCHLVPSTKNQKCHLYPRQSHFYLGGSTCTIATLLLRPGQHSAAVATRTHEAAAMPLCFCTPANSRQQLPCAGLISCHALIGSVVMPQRTVRTAACRCWLPRALSPAHVPAHGPQARCASRSTRLDAVAATP